VHPSTRATASAAACEKKSRRIVTSRGERACERRHQNEATNTLTLGSSAVVRSFVVSGENRVASRKSDDPWLCGPGFRRVCLCRGIGNSELQSGAGAVKRPARGSIRVSSGAGRAARLV
jgi:hypothetical protein